MAWLRKRKTALASAERQGIGAAPGDPARSDFGGSSAAWRNSPPMQRTVGPMTAVTDPQRFAGELTAWQSPATLRPLGHYVVPAGPSGSMTAHTAPPDPVRKYFTAQRTPLQSFVPGPPAVTETPSSQPTIGATSDIGDRNRNSAAVVIPPARQVPDIEFAVSRPATEPATDVGSTPREKHTEAVETDIVEHGLVGSDDVPGASTEVSPSTEVAPSTAVSGAIPTAVPVSRKHSDTSTVRPGLGTPVQRRQRDTPSQPAPSQAARGTPTDSSSPPPANVGLGRPLGKTSVQRSAAPAQGSVAEEPAAQVPLIQEPRPTGKDTASTLGIVDSDASEHAAAEPDATPAMPSKDEQATVGSSTVQRAEVDAAIVPPTPHTATSRPSGSEHTTSASPARPEQAGLLSEPDVEGLTTDHTPGQEATTETTPSASPPAAVSPLSTPQPAPDTTPTENETARADHTAPLLAAVQREPADAVRRTLAADQRDANASADAEDAPSISDTDVDVGSDRPDATVVAAELAPGPRISEPSGAPASSMETPTLGSHSDGANVIEEGTSAVRPPPPSRRQLVAVARTAVGSTALFEAGLLTASRSTPSRIEPPPERLQAATYLAPLIAQRLSRANSTHGTNTSPPHRVASIDSLDTGALSIAPEATAVGRPSTPTLQRRSPVEAATSSSGANWIIQRLPMQTEGSRATPKQADNAGPVITAQAIESGAMASSTAGHTSAAETGQLQWSIDRPTVQLEPAGVERADVAASEADLESVEATAGDPHPIVKADAPSPAELDELASRLYGRIRRHLRQELRLDRERAGMWVETRR